MEYFEPKTIAAGVSIRGFALSPDQYPAQEPFTAIGAKYHDEVLRRGAGVRGVELAYGDDPYQQIAIVPSEHPNGDVLIALHGGGWTHGYKEWMGLNAPAIVAFPAVYVSLSYRLAPAVRYPEPLHDCLAGLRWIYANIGSHGGDPNRVFLGGHSAGAHLSALATLRLDLHERFDLPPDFIKACLPYSGVYDLTMEGPEGARMRVPSTLKLLGEDAAALVPEASPITHARQSKTPFLVTWAENDNAYCRAQGPLFIEALKESASRVEGWMFSLFDHFWIHVDQQRAGNAWTRTLKAWMTGDPETAPVFQP